MLERLFKGQDKKREVIIAAINKAAAEGSCVILGETKFGTQVIIIGRNTVACQLKEIAERKGVELSC